MPSRLTQPVAPAPTPSESSRWYPTSSQLQPDTLHRTLRQVLDQHYALVDAHNKTLTQLQAAQEVIQKIQNDPPRGTGAIDSRILGLPVQPADTSTLANGASLKWDKVSGTFKFS